MDSLESIDKNRDFLIQSFLDSINYKTLPYALLKHVCGEELDQSERECLNYFISITALRRSKGKDESKLCGSILKNIGYEVLPEVLKLYLDNSELTNEQRKVLRRYLKKGALIDVKKKVKDEKIDITDVPESDFAKIMAKIRYDFYKEMSLSEKYIGLCETILKLHIETKLSIKYRVTGLSVGVYRYGIMKIAGKFGLSTTDSISNTEAAVLARIQEEVDDKIKSRLDVLTHLGD
jgi:hypothetical protein